MVVVQDAAIVRWFNKKMPLCGRFLAALLFAFCFGLMHSWGVTNYEKDYFVFNYLKGGEFHRPKTAKRGRVSPSEGGEFHRG
jgi:hypothetical protein